MLFRSPEKLPPIIISALGPKSAEMAGKLGDAFISTKPDKSLVQTFEQAGGKGKPKYAQVTVCYDEDEERAKQTAYTYWPNAGIQGEASQELRLPGHFQQLSSLVTPESLAKEIVCGANPQKHLQQLKTYMEAGYDHIYVHQIGSEQEKCMKFYQEQIIPKLG